MSQFINSVDGAVIEAVQGCCITNPDVRVLCLSKYPTVVVRKDISTSQVALLCGGGSGHEPAHAGFVGNGCLSAAVCGRVFASPPISHITAALDYLLGKKYGSTTVAPGVLVMVKNYTGDVINFGAAVEAAKAKYGMDKVDMHVFGDDVSFGVDHDARRGVAGTVLWYTMVGRLVTNGQNMNLTTVREFAEISAKSIRTMGASLSGCMLPGNQSPNTTVDNGQVELGLGIHGEHGRSVVAYKGVADLVSQLIVHILDPVSAPPPSNSTVVGDKDDSSIEEKGGGGNSWSGEESPAAVLLAVNNLGGCSEIEMSVITHSVVAALNAAGRQQQPLGYLTLAGVGCGSFCTSLNMHGFSITLVNLSTLLKDVRRSSSALSTALPTLQSALDLLLVVSPSDAAMVSSKYLQIVPFSSQGSSFLQLSHGGEQVLLSPTQEDSCTVVPSDLLAEIEAIVEAADPSLQTKISGVATAIRALLQSLAAKEAIYNGYDAATGDGDTGTGVRRAVEELLSSPSTTHALAACITLPSSLPTTTHLITSVFTSISESVCDTFAGSMGALLSTFILSFGTTLANSLPPNASILNVVLLVDSDDSSSDIVSLYGNVLHAALSAAIQAVQRVGGAKEGDRTFLDVLFPVLPILLFLQQQQQQPSPIASSSIASPVVFDIAHIAEQAASNVANLAASKGRARYLGGKEVGHRDPGSEIIKDIILGIYES